MKTAEVGSICALIDKLQILNVIIFCIYGLNSLDSNLIKNVALLLFFMNELKKHYSKV